MIGTFNSALAVTYLAVIGAITSSVLALNSHIAASLIGLILVFLCDLVDGWLARRRAATPYQKRFGIAIDSLADSLNFGVLPMIIGLSLGLTQWWGIALSAGYNIALIHRLAHFDATTETKTTPGFTGLPSVYAALVFPLIWLIFHRTPWLMSAYAGGLVLLGLGFVINVPIPKPRPKFYPLLILLALIMIAAIAWLA